MTGWFRRIWPRSMQGQILLSLALALLLAQSLSAALLYNARQERREAATLHNAAMRLFTASREFQPPHEWHGEFGAKGPQFGHFGRGPRPPAELFGGPRSRKIEHILQFSIRDGEKRIKSAETELRQILEEQNIAVQDVVVVRRAVNEDPKTERRLARRAQLLEQSSEYVADDVLVAAVLRPSNPEWLVVRVVMPPFERGLLLTLAAQTLFIYALLVGAMAFILQRISRPLAQLTDRTERFSQTPNPDGPLVAQGPDDVRRLIVAHNGMEARIAGLLDEKDVMLGAIGHDLKTPLAALRVRIESVEDDAERSRMAATIEDITRSLDDILSLARVGRPTDPLEQVELYSLVASVVEEFEDMDQPVVLGTSERVMLPLRVTWTRRALRNLIGNAVRYGHRARVSMRQGVETELGQSMWAEICVDDDGPGIDEREIIKMLQPFTRGEPSRNSETGGAGLGLTLANAIAQQHKGELFLKNRRDDDGRIAGLSAMLRLPIS